MGMNAITAQADMARTLEELANRTDGQKSLSANGPSMSQSETRDEEQTEITACISTTPPVSENSEPGIEVANLRRNQDKVDLNDLLKDYSDPRGRRASERHNIRLAVVIYAAKRSFRTVTVNVSLGGARLREKLPEQFCNDEVEILFIIQNKHTRQKEYFLVTGKSVISDRVQFTTASFNGKMALRKLLNNLSEKKTA